MMRLAEGGTRQTRHWEVEWKPGVGGKVYVPTWEPQTSFKNSMDMWNKFETERKNLKKKEKSLPTAVPAAASKPTVTRRTPAGSLSLSLSFYLSLSFFLFLFLSPSLSHTHTHNTLHVRAHTHTHTQQLCPRPPVDVSLARELFLLLPWTRQLILQLHPQRSSRMSGLVQHRTPLQKKTVDQTAAPPVTGGEIRCLTMHRQRRCPPPPESVFERDDLLFVFHCCSD